MRTLDRHAAERPVPAGRPDRRRRDVDRLPGLRQTLERPVAIKLMHREIAADSDQLERFRREARAVAQLSHPHIVTVIDAGEDDGRPYIVFEYVAGETLKERIRRDGPPARSPRRWPTRSRSRARSAPPTSAASSTATSSPRTC